MTSGIQKDKRGNAKGSKVGIKINSALSLSSHFTGTPLKCLETLILYK